MAEPNANLDGKHILFYDGLCPYCDGLVQSAGRRDRADRWRFAPQQGEFAQRELARLGVDVAALGVSRVYAIADYGTPRERLLAGANAGIFLQRSLDWRGGLLAGLAALAPPSLRERLYDAFATRRYRFFGRYDACKRPDERMREKYVL